MSDRRLLTETLMRATKGVILDLLDQHAPQMTLILDEQPIQARHADRSYAVLGECVGAGSVKRRVNNLDALRSEQCIEGVCECRVMVMNEIVDRQARIVEFPQQLPSLLGHPSRIRLSCTTGQIHAARREVDEEQHIDGFEEGCLDR